MRPRAVLFDVDDTLVIDEAVAGEALLAACALARRVHGIDPGALTEAVRSNARRVWRASPHIEYCRHIGLSSWEGLWYDFEGPGPDLWALRAWAPSYRLKSWSDALLQFGLRDVGLADRLSLRYRKERRARHALFPGVLPTLQALRPSHRLAIVTNGIGSVQREKLRATRIAFFFEAVVISAETGVAKPDPGIFQAARHLLGVAAHHAVMVGNSLERDVAGARAAGLRAVWLNRAGALCACDVEPDAQIRDLRELPRLLSKGL